MQEEGIQIKKGSMLDIIWVGIVGIMILVTSLIGVYLWDTLSESDIFSTGEGSEQFENAKDGVIAVQDWAIPSMILLQFVSVMIFAYLSPQHPIFTIISIFIMLVGSLVIPVFANLYMIMAEKQALTASADLLPLSTFFVESYPIFFMFMAMGMLIAMVVGGRVQ